MGKGGGSAPAQPAPVAAPDTEAAVRAQAQENRISQFTPTGNLIFGSITPEGGFQLDPDRSGAALQIQESPFQQQIRTSGESAATRVADFLSGQVGDIPTVNLEGLPGLTSTINTEGLPALPGDLSDLRSRTEESVFQRGLNLLNPQFIQREDQLRQQLADQGIPESTAAASGNTGALTAFERGRNESLQNLALDAVTQGDLATQRELGNILSTRAAGIGEQLQGAQLASGTRQQQIGEQQAVRSNLLSEIAAFLGGQQFNPSPTSAFFGPGQIDVLGPQQLALQAQQANQQAGLAQQQIAAQQRASFNQGLFGLGSAAITGGAIAF